MLNQGVIDVLIDGTQVFSRDDNKSQYAVRALKQYMTELSNAVKVAADQGKCFDVAMKEIKLPTEG